MMKIKPSPGGQSSQEWKWSEGVTKNRKMIVSLKYPSYEEGWKELVPLLTGEEFLTDTQNLMKRCIRGLKLIASSRRIKSPRRFSKHCNTRSMCQLALVIKATSPLHFRHVNPEVIDHTLC